MKNVIFSVWLLGICILLTSCKTMYRPNSIHVPVFKEKNSAQADVVMGSSGGELQIGYALTDNWAIMAGGVYDVSKATVMDSIYGVKDGNSNYSNYAVELGLGYYKWLKKDSLYCFSLIGGGGYGKTSGYSDIWYQPDYVSYSGKYYKIFWQPTLTASSEFVDFSVATRFRFLSYTNLANSRDGYVNTGLDTYVEPVISMKAGGESFKFHVQLGTSIPFQKQSNYTAGKLLFSVGFHLNFKKQDRGDYSFE